LVCFPLFSHSVPMFSECENQGQPIWMVNKYVSVSRMKWLVHLPCIPGEDGQLWICIVFNLRLEDFPLFMLATVSVKAGKDVISVIMAEPLNRVELEIFLVLIIIIEVVLYVVVVPALSCYLFSSRSTNSSPRILWFALFSISIVGSVVGGGYILLFWQMIVVQALYSEVVLLLVRWYEVN